MGTICFLKPFSRSQVQLPPTILIILLTWNIMFRVSYVLINVITSALCTRLLNTRLPYILPVLPHSSASQLRHIYPFGPIRSIFILASAQDLCHQVCLLISSMHNNSKTLIRDPQLSNRATSTEFQQKPIPIGKPWSKGNTFREMDTVRLLMACYACYGIKDDLAPICTWGKWLGHWYPGNDKDRPVIIQAFNCKGLYFISSVLICIFCLSIAFCWAISFPWDISIFWWGPCNPWRVASSTTCVCSLIWCMPLVCKACPSLATCGSNFLVSMCYIKWDDYKHQENLQQTQ